MLRSLKQFIKDILIIRGGGSLRDPPWVPVESTNARVLCRYGGFNPHPSFRTLRTHQSWSRADGSTIRSIIGTLKEKKTLGKNTVGEIDCDIN